MRKTLEGRNGKNSESARQLMARLQAALEEVDRADRSTTPNSPAPFISTLSN